ncbi:hypothetical protein ACH5RR_000769 [Cinchona calisaya]|uniref:Uncharacterized protein n=1 Tax=Cinchona calisaya TaxID=153742 RepID=A0ABD3B255_9GENT
MTLESLHIWSSNLQQNMAIAVEMDPYRDVRAMRRRERYLIKKGPKFAWLNKRFFEGPIYQRISRAVSTVDRMNMFPEHSFLIVLDSSGLHQDLSGIPSTKEIYSAIFRLKSFESPELDVIRPNLFKKFWYEDMDTEPDLQSPSRIRGKRNAYGHWKLVQNESHNHETSKDLAGHPFTHVLLEEEVQDIGNLNMSGVLPHQILSFLFQKNPNTIVIARDICNTKQKILKQSLGGHLQHNEDFEWALGLFGDMLGYNNHPSVIIIDRELALMKANQVTFSFGFKSVVCLAY